MNAQSFGFKVGIVTGQVALQAVRLQAGLCQNALYRRLAHSQLTGQSTARPVRASVARLLLHPPRHPRLHGGRSGTGLAALMPSFQSSQPILLEACSPTRDGGGTGSHAFGNLAIALAFGQGQDEPRAEHVPGWQSPRLSPTF